MGEKAKRNFAFCACPNFAANILHLDQKAAKCTICKQLCGDKKIARPALKRVFRQNSRGGEG